MLLYVHRNALSLEMLGELTAAFEQVNAASDARCVLLSAEGHVFSAGHNLKELVMTFNHPVFVIPKLNNSFEDKDSTERASQTGFLIMHISYEAHGGLPDSHCG